MENYIRSLGEFLNDDPVHIVEQLQIINPDAEKSQVHSWVTLVNDIRNSNISGLPEDIIVSLEYNLPTDGMGIDFIVIGFDREQKKHAFLIEAKQWSDANVFTYNFGEYRNENQTLHPQIQISRHSLAFKDYTDIGHDYQCHPYVYMNNLSQKGINFLESHNPQSVTKGIPIVCDINTIISEVKKVLVTGGIRIITDLKNAVYKPSKSIITAMESMVSHHEPFILTEEQNDVVNQIFSAFDLGKKIIRITGAAGSGKTAILLHTYIRLLNEQKENVRPIFISGAQNTKLYQNMFREVERSFTFSFSLDRMVGKTIGDKYFICMDEAQHNENGIITSMINRRANLILCYDDGQTINADNALEELRELSNRDDFVAICLKNSVRFSGSQIFEKNAKGFLNGEKDFENDYFFEFKIFDSVEELEAKTIDVIKNNPTSTVAVTGLLSNDASVIANRSGSKIFIDWGYLGECKWIPYIEKGNYLDQFNGKLWVGTWWLPGLDVDYISVIIGGDAKMTDNGVVAIPEGAKHYKMMLSVARKLGYPEYLFVNKQSFGKTVLDTVNSTRNVIKFIDEDQIRKEQFIREFTILLKNNYYILLTRGRKGCFVCFAENKKITNSLE